MDRKACMLSAAALGLALALALPPAQAVERGFLPGGGAYVSGGIGQEEIAELAAERALHSLWLVTAAKGSGAYLADAQVRVMDSKGRRVFEGTLAGPWLLLDLAPGRYAVEVRCEGQVRQLPLTIPRGAGTRQLVFYFDVPVDVLPRGERGG